MRTAFYQFHSQLHYQFRESITAASKVAIDAYKLASNSKIIPTLGAVSMIESGYRALSFFNFISNGIRANGNIIGLYIVGELTESACRIAGSYLAITGLYQALAQEQRVSWAAAPFWFMAFRFGSNEISRMRKEWNSTPLPQRGLQKALTIGSRTLIGAGAAGLKSIGTATDHIPVVGSFLSRFDHYIPATPTPTFRTFLNPEQRGYCLPDIGMNYHPQDDLPNRELVRLEPNGMAIVRRLLCLGLSGFVFPYLANEFRKEIQSPSLPSKIAGRVGDFTMGALSWYLAVASVRAAVATTAWATLPACFVMWMVPLVTLFWKFQDTGFYWFNGFQIKAIAECSTGLALNFADMYGLPYLKPALALLNFYGGVDIPDRKTADVYQDLLTGGPRLNSQAAMCGNAIAKAGGTCEARHLHSFLWTAHANKPSCGILRHAGVVCTP